MSLQRWIIRIFLSVVVLAGTVAVASPEQSVEEQQRTFEALSRQITGGSAIQLKELEIRAKIYEPQVIYILDRTRLEIAFPEDSITFSNRIPEPLVEERW